MSTGANSENDCTDSGNPCATLQYAIDQANAGDTIDVAGTIDSNVTVAESLTITQWPGQASAVLDGTNSGTVVTIDGGDGSPLPVTLSDLTIKDGLASGGSGVASDNSAVTVDNVTFSSNSATGFGGGGGIASGSGGTLTVEHSTFVNNSAAAGGAIFNVGPLTVEDSTFSGNSSTPMAGGAIDEENDLATVLRSTFTGNSSSGNGEGSNGGAIYVGANATLLVADSTFTANSADVVGGAIAGDAITVESSTFTGNSAGSGGAAIASAHLPVQLAADIFAKQASGTNCWFGFSPPNGFIDAGYNVDDDGTCDLSAADHSVSDSSAIDDYLGRLADNGGSTKTVALLRKPDPATSAADPALAVVPPSFDLPQAVDGKNAACSVPDQRGVPSPAGAHCDIGAYQTSPPSAPGALTGRVAHDSLHLSWQASEDNVGVDHYVIYLGRTRIGTVAGTTTQATVRMFRRHGASVFTVRAFDAAGNRSEASNAVTAVRVPRPTSAPKRIPRWAWHLLAWQEHRSSTRPVTPDPLPDWYASWKRWRENLFRLAG